MSITLKYVVLLSIQIVVYSGILNDERIKGDDEPHLVNSKWILEGVTEPFDGKNNDLPSWRAVKDSADQKLSSQLIHQALHEYGQLIKHPYIFGQMPLLARYDVFLSMAKLLKQMGFYQRAEVLLYEAMSYNPEPYEAHLQLGLLFLDREDLDRAKVHFKNCVFYKETDIYILVHLVVILIAEGKIHEAKFYVTRVLTSLEDRVKRLAFLFDKGKDKRKSTPTTTSETLAAVIGSEDVTPSPQSHSTFLSWVEDLTLKVLLGEFKIIPSATVDMYRLFSRLFHWLSDGEMSGRFVFDLGQSLYEGGRPQIGAMMMRRGTVTADQSVEGLVSMEVMRLRMALDFPVVPESALEIVSAYLNLTDFLSQSQREYEKIDLANVLDVAWSLPLWTWSALPIVPIVKEVLYRFNEGPVRKDQMSQGWLQNPAILGRRDNRSAVVEVGVMGGHFSGHPVGQIVLRRVLAELTDRTRFRVTLLALPLRPDAATRAMVDLVAEVVNLSADPDHAWRRVQSLSLDVLVFPDWQPFPDQLSMYLQSRRIAPVQLCIYVRGGGCLGAASDYYLIPEDLALPYTQTWRGVGVWPLWLRDWAEQSVLVSWPVFTAQAIRELGAMAEATPSSADDEDQQLALKSPDELEGPVFFEGQPVAVLPCHPTHVHPLMDEVLFQILLAVPSLQILIVLPATFFGHSSTVSRMAWARRLLRRLSARGGSLSQRIRLLPAPLSDSRLLQLLRRADLALDSFPIGSSLHALGLALSVGTPVVTMDSGLMLHSSKQDLAEIRSFLRNSKRFLDNPMFLHLSKNDVPWVSTRSLLAKFYDSSDLRQHLVANGTGQYVALATRVLRDRELSYELRVKLLAAVDDEKGSGLGKGRSDIARFVEVVGRPWAVERASSKGKISSRGAKEQQDGSFWSSSIRREDPEEALDEDTRRRLKTI